MEDIFSEENILTDEQRQILRDLRNSIAAGMAFRSTEPARLDGWAEDDIYPGLHIEEAGNNLFFQRILNREVAPLLTGTKFSRARFGSGERLGDSGLRALVPVEAEEFMSQRLQGFRRSSKFIDRRTGGDPGYRINSRSPILEDQPPAEKPPLLPHRPSGPR